MVELFNFAVATIFAREVLEGAIIIGEYRTIILRASGDQLDEDQKKQYLRAIVVAALLASLLALLVCAAVAIPLALLSRNFDARTAMVIEGCSKLVAAVCILQLSLKLPKWLGLYRSRKRRPDESNDDDTFDLSLRGIRFNVAWNIWREVAECGVFLIPFFLNGDGVLAIPLSAVVGTLVGLAAGAGLYYANSRMENKVSLAIFSVLLLNFLSTGLFTSGCHKLEMVIGSTPTVWTIQGDFWSVDRLPMTIIKPFGYSNSRTVLQIVCFWSWLLFGFALHYRKIRITRRIRREERAKYCPAPSTAEEGVYSAPPSEVDPNEQLEVEEIVSSEEGVEFDVTNIEHV